MKNMTQYTKNITINWATPLLGLLTAHYYFTGAITHWSWWILIVIAVLSGNYKK